MQFKLTTRGRRLIYLGIVVYLIFLLTTLPASFLSNYILPSVSAAQSIKLQGVHGTIWKGYAMESSVDRFRLGRMDWKLSGWGLLLGDVDLDIKFENQASRGHGDVSVGMGGTTQARDLELQFPAEVLQPLVYGLPISFSGELRGSIQSLEFKKSQVLKSQGRVVWQSAALRAPQNIELGSFLVTLEPLNSGTKVKIKDDGRGPIVSDINLSVKGNGEYKLNGWLKARDERQQHITEALRIIGRSDSSGRFWVGYSGKIAGW